jgi:hypothetical protein
MIPNPFKKPKEPESGETLPMAVFLGKASARGSDTFFSCTDRTGDKIAQAGKIHDCDLNKQAPVIECPTSGRTDDKA